VKLYDIIVVVMYKGRKQEETRERRE